MGLNHISIAAVITLLGASSALHAETAPPAASPPVNTTAAAPAPVDDDPALKASPIAGTTPAAPAPATPEATTPTQPAPETTAPTAQPPVPAKATAPAKTKGDVLKMPKKAPASKKKKAPSTPVKTVADGMPGRGATMAQVEQRFGAPREKLPPVGKPPITRWIYSNYTVYFEYEYVIDSVRNTPAAAPEQAAPVTAPQQPAAPATEAAPAEPAVPETAAPGEAPPASGQ